MELNDGLPPSVAEIVEWVGEYSAVYGYVKWNEQAKIKADMMNAWQRWVKVDPVALAAKCLAAGFTQDETDEVLDWLKRRKQGRRLVPAPSYRTFRFPQHPESPEPGPIVRSSSIW